MYFIGFGARLGHLDTHTAHRSVRRGAWWKRHPEENMIATTRARRPGERAAPANSSSLSVATNDRSEVVSPSSIQAPEQGDKAFSFGQRSVWLVTERHAGSVHIRAITGDRGGASRIADKHDVGLVFGDDNFWCIEPHPLNVQKLVL